MEVALVGMGRLGRSLALLLERAGHRVLRLHGRDALPPAPLTWLTVPDSAVAEVARRVPPGGILLHASGALPVEVLRPHHPAGSLHLIQSFPGPEQGIPSLEGVPAAVAGDPEAVEVARELARSLGLRPFELRGDRRLYHAACVLAGNLATLLLLDAAELLELAGAPPGEAAELLLPLARRSLEAALAGIDGLTGPLARGDASTLRAHREALSRAAPGLLPVYDALSRRGLERLAGRLPPGRLEALRELLAGEAP